MTVGHQFPVLLGYVGDHGQTVEHGADGLVFPGKDGVHGGQGLRASVLVDLDQSLRELSLQTGQLGLGLVRAGLYLRDAVLRRLQTHLGVFLLLGEVVQARLLRGQFGLGGLEFGLGGGKCFIGGVGRTETDKGEGEDAGKEIAKQSYDHDQYRDPPFS